MHVSEDEVSFIGVLPGSLMFCSCAETVKKPYLGGYCGGVPPLPIPNREVKPACADGTAMQCGRVGGRLFFRVESLTSVMMSGTLFLFGPTGDEINGTNKTNVTYFKETYGDIPNDLPYTLDILPHKCTYV